MGLNRCYKLYMTRTESVHPPRTPDEFESPNAKLERITFSSGLTPTQFDLNGAMLDIVMYAPEILFDKASLGNPLNCPNGFIFMSIEGRPTLLEALPTFQVRSAVLRSVLRSVLTPLCRARRICRFR